LQHLKGSAGDGIHPWELNESAKVFGTHAFQLLSGDVDRRIALWGSRHRGSHPIGKNKKPISHSCRVECVGNGGMQGGVDVLLRHNQQVVLFSAYEPQGR
jgi:hypothetical protein